MHSLSIPDVSDDDDGDGNRNPFCHASESESALFALWISTETDFFSSCRYGDCFDWWLQRANPPHDDADVDCSALNHRISLVSHPCALFGASSLSFSSCPCCAASFSCGDGRHRTRSNHWRHHHHHETAFSVFSRAVSSPLRIISRGILFQGRMSHLRGKNNK